MNRTEMRRCGKPFDSEAAVKRSKTWTDEAAAVECHDPDCGRWHMEKPRAAPKALARKAEMPARSAEPKVKVPAPRAAPGHVKAAVSMVLAGERTVADAAREFEVDPRRLQDAVLDASRVLVLERDSYACAACGKNVIGAPYSVQHRVARGSGGSSKSWINTPVNLITLCGSATTPGSCHLACEERDEGMRARGFWLWQYQDPADYPVFIATEQGLLMALWLLPNGEYADALPNEGTRS